MNPIAIVALAVVPSLLVLLAALVSQRYILRENRRVEGVANAVENRKITVPIRLQAYERLALLLERISPEALLLRTDAGQNSAKQFEAILLEAIRAEWNHNLSQQIYVSLDMWNLVKNAKGNVSKLITLCGEKTHPDAPAGELSKTILAALLEMQTHPTTQALNALRAEAAKLF